MQLPLSEARCLLEHLCTLAQDPREIIVLTRHNTPVAAIVSMAEVQRIWDLQDIDARGPRTREAALQMREVQMTRATEREILAAGGLEPVEGGEVAVTVRKGWRRWFWFG